MLFNSYIFLLCFFPATILGAAFAQRLRSPMPLQAWLFAMSCFFYSWWYPEHLPLLLCSMTFNWWMGKQLAKRHTHGNHALALGIVLNLALLCIFKYARFFLENINAVTGTNLATFDVALPLGISFFTFHQIAYLTDAHHDGHAEQSFIQYGLFVSFFPHLIAGPILRRDDFFPQLHDGRLGLRYETIATGLAFIATGLFKKVCIADPLSLLVDPSFSLVSAGTELTLAEAWVAALGFTFQLYFDFSGYADIAIGLAYCLGIRFPFNFNSPYKALGPVDFWRRWHMTLSRFLRDYLYIPLGGNRGAPTARALRLLATFLLAGLWHGAGWTFVAWGGYHGLAVMINHAWNAHRKEKSPLPRTLTLPGTFLFAVFGWVLFRTPDFASAASLMKSMLGVNGIAAPARIRSALPMLEGIFVAGSPFAHELYPPKLALATLCVLLAWVWGLPNSQELILSQGKLRWQSTPVWGVAHGIALALSLLFMLGWSTPFVYFQF